MSDLIKREDAIATIGVMYERCDTYDIIDYRDLMLEAVKVLPSADRPQEWMPCSERLPNEYEVLCCDIYRNCIVGHPFADDSASTGFSAESEGEFMYECVAWMPLPKLWKGADDETD